MKYLAWDTSSKAGSIVAFETFLEAPFFHVVSEMTLNVDATHSEKLLWAIHQILEASRWKLSDLDGFGVGVGPGSFTGLRIGLTTARTLGQSLRKPLMPVSSLRALLKPVALNYLSYPFVSYVIGSTDACKGELFSLWGKAKDILSLCSFDLDKKLENDICEQVLVPQMLMDQIQKALDSDPHSRWIAIGEGRNRYFEFWNQLPADREIQNKDLFNPIVQPRFLAQIVADGFKKNLQRDPLQVFPDYIRASDAEIRLNLKNTLKLA